MVKRTIAILLLLSGAVFAADSYYQIPSPEGSGKKMRSINQTIGGNDVYQQNILVSDPTTSYVATVTTDGALKVDCSSVTQPVSGTFWQATQPVSGTFWQATQPVSATALDVRALTSATDSVECKQATGTNLHAVIDSGSITVSDGAGALNTIVDSGTLTAVTSITNAVTVAQGTASSLKAEVIGIAADNSAAATNNVSTLPAIVETSTTPITRTDSNRAALIEDSDGKVYVRTFDWDPLFATSGLATATSLTQLIAAPGASVSIYITGWKCSASVAATTTTDQQCTIKYGTGSNCGTGTTYVDGCFQNANGGCAESMDSPIKIPANNALCWIHAATGSKIVRVNYFLAP